MMSRPLLSPLVVAAVLYFFSISSIYRQLSYGVGRLRRRRIWVLFFESRLPPTTMVYKLYCCGKKWWVWTAQIINIFYYCFHSSSVVIMKLI